MPANTPNIGLPYPLGTDRAMDGDDAIHSLATKLDGSQAACPGPVEVSNNQTVVVLRSGIVVISINFTVSMALGAGMLVFNVPAGYRPSAGLWAFCYDTTGPALNPLTITTNGQALLNYAPVVNRVYRGSAAWAIGPASVLLPAPAAEEGNHDAQPTA